MLAFLTFVPVLAAAVYAIFAPLLGLKLSWQRTDKFKQSSSVARAFLASKTETLMALAFFAIGALLLRFARFEPLDCLALASFYFLGHGAAVLLHAGGGTGGRIRAAPAPLYGPALSEAPGR